MAFSPKGTHLSTWEQYAGQKVEIQFFMPMWKVLLTTNSVFNSKNELSNIPLQLENLWLQSLENLVNSTTTLLQPLTAF